MKTNLIKSIALAITALFFASDAAFCEEARGQNLPEALTISDFVAQYNACSSEQQPNECKKRILKLNESTLSTQQKKQSFSFFGTNTIKPSSYHENSYFQKYILVKTSEGNGDGAPARLFRVGVGFFFGVNDSSGSESVSGTVSGNKFGTDGSGESTSIYFKSLGIQHGRIKSLIPVAPEINESTIDGIGQKIIDAFNGSASSGVAEAGKSILDEDAVILCPQVLAYQPLATNSGGDVYALDKKHSDIGNISKELNKIKGCTSNLPNYEMTFVANSKAALDNAGISGLFNFNLDESAAYVFQQFKRYRFKDGYGENGMSAIYAIGGSGPASSSGSTASLGAGIIQLQSNAVNIQAKFNVLGATDAPKIPAAPSTPSFSYVFSVYKTFQSAVDVINNSADNSADLMSKLISLDKNTLGFSAGIRSDDQAN